MGSVKTLLDYIGCGAVCGLIGVVIGAGMAWEAGYLVGLIDQNKTNLSKVKTIVETEFEESCRPWFTDHKRQTHSEVYMCHKPKFVKVTQ